jgi:hypothetical protein
VIAQAYLNEWASRAPWPQQVQIQWSETEHELSRRLGELHADAVGVEIWLRGVSPAECGKSCHDIHVR